VFSESTISLATFLPEGGGYAPFMFGRVVDMFYFPLFSGQYPQWIPWLGGSYFEFFQPVFNIADACISVGVAVMLIFQKRVFADQL
jgi:signal peptidase II